MGRPSSRTALVGRSREFSSLLHVCASGPGGLSLVEGEAGSGKSRLLKEVCERAAADGMQVVLGHTVPGGGAYRPLAEALVKIAHPDLATTERIAPFRSTLARLLPAWPTAPIEAPRVVDPVVVLGEALLELLRAVTSDGRTVIALDDLQWADRDTLAVLEYLAGPLVGLPVRVLATARSDERVGEGWSALRRHSAVDVHVLGRLDAAQTEAMARSVLEGEWDAQVLEHVVSASEGLPLLIEELCSGLAGGGVPRSYQPGWRMAIAPAAAVPEVFAEMVSQRVAMLSDAEAEIVRVTALLGRDLSWDLVPIAANANAETAARALRRASVEAGLFVTEHGGRLKWRHALIQDAVLATMTEAEGALLSSRAAEALDGAGLHGAHVGLVADLYARAGSTRRAAELLLCLAREYRSAGALAGALSVLERAAALADDVSGVDIAAERVTLLALSARTDEAIAVGEPVLATSASVKRTTLAVALARACADADRFVEARAYLDRVHDDSDPRVQALLARIALGLNQMGEALSRADAVAEQAERDGQPEIACDALEVAGRGRRRSDPRSSQEAFRRAERIAERHGLIEWRTRALSELGVSDLFGTSDGQSLRKAKELAGGAGMLGTATMLELQLTALSSVVDGPVAASVQGEECAEHAGRLGLSGVRAHALMFVARGRVFAGRGAEAGPLFDEAAALASTPVHIDSSRFLARAHDAWFNGDPAAAAVQLDSCVDVLARTEGSNAAPSWGEWAVLRTALDPTDARPADLLRSSDVLVQALNRAALHYCDAVIAAESGRSKDAADALALAEELTATRPFHRYLLRTYLLQRTVLGDSESVLREALGWLAGTDEMRMTRWCRSALLALGASVPRPDRDLSNVPPPLRGLGITGREFDVLVLLAEGLTNPEIAFRLQLSRRTIETHVSSLLAKTGATGRRDVTRWLV